MRKTITNFLVLAALVLAVPVQAQTLQKKATTKKIETPQRLTLKSAEAVKAAQLKAADTQEGISFREASQAEQVSAQAQARPERIPVGTTGKAVSLKGQNMRNVNITSTGRTPRKAGAAEGEVTDEHGIIITPAEGESKTYTRSGEGYYASGGYYYVSTQSGSVEIVECSDGTVYVKDIISFLETGAWVKGTKSGNTITIPANQPLYYESSEYFTTVSLRWGKFSSGTPSAADEHADAFTFTVVDNTISLQGTTLWSEDGESYFMGVFWDDDDSWLGVGDAETVWTPFSVVTEADVPYSNGFGDASEQAAFTIIDANDDGKTWSYNTNGYAYYTYNGSADGDDWLISPAIKLEAGKTYRVAIDTRCQMTKYPERVEMKMGNAATAAAMTTGVIASTDVNWDALQTIQNIAVTVTESGNYYFGIHAISDKDMYYLIVDNFIIEESNPDVPAAVTDLTVTPTDNVVEATITFTAPSTTAVGEALTDNLSIDILRDGAVITTLNDVAPGSAQTFVDNNETGLSIGKHTYQVVATNAAGEGAKSEEVTVSISGIIEVPYTADLTKEGCLDLFSIIDANADGKTWQFSGSTYYSYNSSSAADDYLVTSAIRLYKGKNYDLIVNAAAASTSYPERFEVKLGKEATVAGLNTTIMSPQDVTATTAEDFESSFSVEEDGIYYVAIHAISDADKYKLYVNKLTIDLGAEPTAPAIAQLEVVPDALGALTAEVSVTAPTTAVDGSALTENLTKIEVYRDEEVVKTFEDVAPGATVTFTDNVPAAGTYTYQAIPYNVSGIGVKSEKASVFIGQDIPVAAENFAATDNVTTVGLTWDKVGNVGVNGGYVNPAEVDYNVWSTKIEETIFGSQLVLDEVIGTVRDGDSFDVPYNTDEGEQGYEYWGLQTSNATGECEDIYAAALLVGAPYELPLVEGFTGSSLHYFWTSDAELNVSEDATDGDGVALMMFVEEAGEVSFDSGKLNLKSAGNPTLLFDVKGTGITSMKVKGSVDGAEMTDVQTVPVTSEYTTVKVPLSSLRDGRYAQIGLSANFVNATVVDIDWSTWEYIYDYGDLLYIDNIRIADLYEYNLSAAVNAPKTVTAGKTAAITATVKNEGEFAASGYTVTIKAGEKELLNQTVSEELAPFKTKEFTAELATTIFDEAADVTIKVEVDFENELLPDDNVAETIISIVESSSQGPTDLAAVENETGGIDVSWAAPATGSSEEVTEDFEEDMGGWTAVDNDGDGYNWTHQINGETNRLSTHSGEGCVYSESYVNNVGAVNPDNWLISPQAILNGNFTFWAVGQDASWAAEKFAVFATTGDPADLDSYTQVSEEFTATGDMTEYSADLSSFAGANGYVAIRHFNVTDMFILVVDDITYLVGGGSVDSYNIYLDGELIGTADGDEVSYTIDPDAVDAGEHTVSVTAVYGGTESKPVTTTVTVATGIEQISVNGQPVDIYSIDGKLVRSQAKSLDGLRGIYVINGKKVLVK
ncbi:MAG: choice-of-anchor J domain-containing protein [Prevotella sp.]|nr:choice-of-anchor J domain-containing protein [Prevotella sp.]